MIAPVPRVRPSGRPISQDAKGTDDRTITTDTCEGIINDTGHFHYDVFADMPYPRLLADEETETYADVTDESDFLLRDQEIDRPVGLTVFGWRKPYGHGEIPASFRDLA